MSDDSTAIKNAPAPFSGVPDQEGNIPNSDLIIRASDGVDLHVHRDILMFISVFFKNILDGSGSLDAERDGKPVVCLSEDSTVMHRLLCIAYPGRSLDSVTAQILDGICGVHEAAQKYLFTGAMKLLEKMLEHPALLNVHPHRVFAIARIRDLPDLARKAALVTLSRGVCPPALDFPELELLPAATFQALHNFHYACGESAKHMAEMQNDSLEPTDVNGGDPHYITVNTNTSEIFVWWKERTISGSASFHSAGCGPSTEYKMGNVICSSAKWFRNHSTLLGAKLRACPTGATAERKGVRVAHAERERINSCQACQKDADRDLQNFTRQLAMRITEFNERLALAQL